MKIEVEWTDDILRRKVDILRSKVGYVACVFPYRCGWGAAIGDYQITDDKRNLIIFATFEDAKAAVEKALGCVYDEASPFSKDQMEAIGV